MPTNAYTTPGADSHTWKDGVTKADVECYGGGANGTAAASSDGEAGGGGGAFAFKANVARTGATDSLYVAGAGEDSWFVSDTTVLAKGTTTQTGGAAGSCIGDTTFSGGDGANGVDPDGGGGGGCAGLTANGGNGSDATGGAGNGNGGNGGEGGVGSGDNGDPGQSPGGGGGGGAGGDPAGTGGAGARGEVRVTTVAGHLAFVAQPSNANSGVNISPSITVECLDVDNARDTAATGNVTISIASGTGAIGGTLIVAMVAGLATFAAVNVTGRGAHTLQAAHADCTSATSNSFNITAIQPPFRRRSKQFFRPVR
jgi:hypothetical protein